MRVKSYSAPHRPAVSGVWARLHYKFLCKTAARYDLVPMQQAPTTEIPASPREKWMVFFMGVAVVLVIMNTMMFNLALPKVALEFTLSPAETSWIVTAYSIMFAIASITYSRLSDFIPIRRLFLIGLASLGTAAIAGFFVRDFVVLIGVRVLQASGAGSIPGLALVFISRHIPIERRGRAMAKVMAAVALGLGLGPVVGGAIVEYAGWHYLFLLTASALLLLPVFAALVPQESPRHGTFDIAGAVFAATGITLLLMALTQKSAMAFAGGSFSVLLFVWRIRSARQPFVMPALFANTPFLKLAAVGVAAYISSFALLFIMPQMLVKLHRLSAIEAGLAIFPGSIMAMLVSPITGKTIDRHGNRGILRLMPWVMAAGTLLLALFARDGYIWLSLAYLLVSVAFTFITSSVSNEMSRLLIPAQIGAGLGLFQLMQFFSGAFGVALSATALVWQRDFSPAESYSNIYFGMTVILLLSVVSGHFYLKSRARAAG